MTSLPTRVITYWEVEICLFTGSNAQRPFLRKDLTTHLCLYTCAIKECTLTLKVNITRRGFICVVHAMQRIAALRQ